MKENPSTPVVMYKIHIEKMQEVEKHQWLLHRD